MFRTLAPCILILLPAIVGCLEVERPCPEGTCFPLTSSAFNTILDDLGEIDALQLSEEYDRLGVSTITRFTDPPGVDGEISWVIEKDDEKEVRLVANSVVVGGMAVVDYEIWDGGPDTYTRTDGHWMKGRDMEPEYEDPFKEIARLATEDDSNTWPPFRYDVSQFSDLSWTITGDAFESYQIARATFGTEEIYFELKGLPPRIVGMAIYSDGLGQDDLTFSISFATEDWDQSLSTEYYFSYLSGGAYLEISGLADFPRSTVPFIPVPGQQSTNGGIISVTGTVPSEMSHEATLSEIEMHVFSEGSSVASLILNEGNANISTGDGSWWDMEWVDGGHKGLLSHSDVYSVRTNSPNAFEIRIFDNWAKGWTDGAE